MTSRIFLYSIFLLGVLAPASVQAAVQITEIMYDVSGADAGREWIEITNTGDSAVDVSGYKFFEANTNHALSAVSGTGVLQPGSAAIIADDTSKFLTDWPAYSGTLFDSSFSLSNTGESIAVKDGVLSVLDTVAYDPAWGAAGDGQTLTRSGSSFAPAAPSPGTYAASTPSPSEGDSMASAPSSSANNMPVAVSSSGATLPAITVHIAADVLTMVGGGSFFSAQAFGTAGLPLPGARYLWNFGDGSTAEGVRVFHAYTYPGKYSVSVTASHNYSSALERITVEAVPAQVSLLAMGDGSLLVRNKATADLNIGLWSLAAGKNVYVIPEDTLVLAGEGIRFSPAITQVTADPDASLRYPNNAVAASASPGPDAPSRGERVTAPELQALAYPATPPSSAVSPGPDEIPLVSQTAAAGEADLPSNTPDMALWGSVAALVGVLAVGATGVRYLQPRVQKRAETTLSADEFDIE